MRNTLFVLVKSKNKDVSKTVVADFATTHLKYLLIITKLHRQNKEKLYNFGLAFQ